MNGRIEHAAAPRTGSSRARFAAYRAELARRTRERTEDAR